MNKSHLASEDPPTSSVCSKLLCKFLPFPPLTTWPVRERGHQIWPNLRLLMIGRGVGKWTDFLHRSFTDSGWSRIWILMITGSKPQIPVFHPGGVRGRAAPEAVSTTEPESSAVKNEWFGWNVSFISVVIKKCKLPGQCRGSDQWRNCD